MNWDFSRPIGDTSIVDDWLERGGIAYDGIAYGPPASAKAWGTAGCPLVPRVYRLRYGHQPAPELLRKALKKPDLMVAELDSEVLRHLDPRKLSDALLKSIRDLIYKFQIRPGDVAIPPGVPVTWVTALPIDYRLRSRLSNYPWPHDRLIEKPFLCSQLLGIRWLGKSSLNELLCVLESVEMRKEQDEKKASPTVTEMTARILGREQSGNKISSDKIVQEQDETRHDKILAEDKVLPSQEFVHNDTVDSSFQRAVYEAARQAIRAGFLQFDSNKDLTTVIDGEKDIICSVSALGDLLRYFVTWALAETDSQTIGEAISQSMLRTDVPEAWQAIAELELRQAGHKPNHPYSILESWVDHLPDRERHIFNTRIAPLEGVHTLKELGDYYGITRERARQLESRTLRKLTLMMKRESAWPIRWRAETIRQNIGVAAPLASVEHLLACLNGQFDFRGIVLKLAGPYSLLNGWLVLKSALNSDPTAEIRNMADETGFIDSRLAAQELKDWGLDVSLHEEWLARDGKIRNLNGRLVRWDGSIRDKLVIGLTEIGRPATIEELLDYIQENRTKSSIANALSIDSRAVKVGRQEWALESWGLSEYSSIAMSIRNVLKSQEHLTSIEDVVRRLMKDLELKENSIRAYCQAPMFILENGAIRLRRDDEPFVYYNVSLQNAKGVFAPGPHRVSILFEVDGELLRGSGRSLAPAAGSLLGVALNRPLTFNGHDGLSVTLTYPETSISGPSIGSLRPFAEASGARIGDLLTLTLDKSDMSVIAVATDRAQHEPGWQLVSRLTGIDADEGLEGLAKALNCGKGEVRAMLTDRKDVVVKDALPKRQVSSELDHALASLEAQLQQTGGSLH